MLLIGAVLPYWPLILVIAILWIVLDDDRHGEPGERRRQRSLRAFLESQPPASVGERGDMRTSRQPKSTWQSGGAA